MGKGSKPRKGEDTRAIRERWPMKKPKREQDKKYLEWMRLQACIVTEPCSVLVVAHHISAGGMGTKCSDYETVPLCNEHHREIHDKGKKTFQAKYSIDLKEEAERLKGEWDELQDN